MLRSVMVSPGKIEFHEVEKPELKPGQVLIKIMRIGICGSDIHVNHGKHPFTKYPVTQGHEVSGKIVEVAEDVKHLKVGQKVTIEPQVVCGKCHPCRTGKYNLCEELKVMGFQTVGTGSEYFAVHAKNVTPVPDHLSYDEAAMIEPLAVTVHAVNRAGDVKDKDIVVIGAGPIGILLVQTLKAKGASKVMVTDISDYRLELALKCGADFAVNTKNEDFGEAMLRCFGPDKADIIYDCAGNNITIDQAIRHSRKGSIIVLVAVFEGMATVDLATLNDKELDLNTSMMYRHEDYLEAIELVEAGKVSLNPLMSQHFAFKDWEKAYEYIDNNRETTMKVLIDVNNDED
ncbi:zinc-dependent alcohol dehydrogenase [Acetivibrio mesophilus]|uniref:Alcohol dehydrogenase n=1 Tax=Acetivibrio mesophilus TaxID=2487273 RepID=A0A4Q0I8J7_9FIRM|nr:alcohol dehydrogenase catalytic domain-containing protein [Acetivibrio mesophilus]ODM25753.1 alcohol dehydrogenase [Clostridium sp. Bc-iso-3]RXE60337.1 alcohol dehydrogenase [Acetivibrio mesophilus]